jgi:hypothetical protein
MASDGAGASRCSSGWGVVGIASAAPSMGSELGLGEEAGSLVRRVTQERLIANPQIPRWEMG